MQHYIIIQEQNRRGAQASLEHAFLSARQEKGSLMVAEYLLPMPSCMERRHFIMFSYKYVPWRWPSTFGSTHATVDLVSYNRYKSSRTSCERVLRRTSSARERWSSTADCTLHVSVFVRVCTHLSCVCVLDTFKAASYY